MAKAKEMTMAEAQQIALAKAAACRDLGEHLRCGMVDGAEAVGVYTDAEGTTHTVVAKVVFDLG